jgi:pimeloyl-ACP methyl ester carboxylesterase
MASVTANGITVEYETWGDPAAPPILLIMGLGMQLTSWPDAFRDGLVAQGFRVIAFDNRDCGLSTRIRVRKSPNLMLQIARAWARLPVRAPYTLDDMAADTVALLDALGVARAHLVGVSMGGMIAQVVAARHPERTASLTSIMSSSGNRRVSRSKPDARRALLSRPDDPDNPESVTRHLIELFGVIGSPGYPADHGELRQRIERSVRRSYYPAGTAHQLLAIMASGDRRWLLPKISAPTLVIHGAADPLVPVAAGRDTAHHIKGAELKVIDGMGHDLPLALQPVLVEAIAAHCRAAAPAAAPLPAAQRALAPAAAAP